MDKSDKAKTMRQLAAKMRGQADETAQPEYQHLMHRVANSLDAEAQVIADRQLQEFSRALEAFCDSQFSTGRIH